MTGTIKRLVMDRAFGFIRGDGEQQDYFFHATGCAVPFSELREGQRVTFNVESSPRGRGRATSRSRTDDAGRA